MWRGAEASQPRAEELKPLLCSVFSVEVGGRRSAEISEEQEGQKGLITLNPQPPPPPIPLLPPPLLLCSKVMKPKWNPFEAVKPAGNESRPPIWTPDDDDSSVNRTELA